MKPLMTLKHLSVTVLLLSLTGCFGSSKPQVTMIEGMPPKFEWYGPGLWSENPISLYEFVVIAPPAGAPGFNEIFRSSSIHNPNVIWRIEPVDAGVRFENAPLITYGEVPKGWRQTHPESGPAPPLVDGQSYYAGQPFTSQDAILLFKVKAGKTIVN